MNQICDPAVDSSKETISAFGVRTKDRVLAHVRQEPVKTFAIVFAGSILVSVLVGYRISRLGEVSKRQRLVENWIREVTDWIGRQGREISVPVKEGFEATKTAVEDFSNSTARVGRRVPSFLEKQKHSFLNLF